MDFVSPLLKLVPFLRGQLEKEFLLASDAEMELEVLKNLIGAIDRFLKKANSMEAFDEELIACIKQARKFLYVSEDAIDDFMRGKSYSKWEGLGPYFYRHYNCRTFASVAKEIQKMVERTAFTETLNGFSGKHAQFSSASHQSISFSEETDDALVGIHGARNQLVQWLTENDSMPKVIFVTGAQGVGKTSLVGAALRNENVKSHFKYYVWIEDLRSCELGTAAALMKANAKMWDLTIGEGNNQRDCKLEEAFTLMEANCSWALVMDDASRADLFESLRSHLNGTRPSVLVTTRVSSLASSSAYFLDSLGAQYVSHDFKHDFLTEYDSRFLFCLMMSPQDIHRDDLQDASDRILEKCEGLPLAILATCKLLKTKRPSATGTPDGVKWKKLSGRLGEALLSNGYRGGPNRKMIAHHMDPLLDVHACILYLSIFPLDCPIRCSTMMRLWMAEGFIEQEGTQTAQEKAEEALEKLLEHNVIQEKKKTSYGRVKTCCVHNIQHQGFIFSSINEELAMIVAGQVERWPENVWHLSFHSDMDPIYNPTRVEQLRSLVVFKKVCLKSLEKLLEKAKRLKVLDLQRHLTSEEKRYFQASLNTFPQKILQSKYLRYLSLRGTKVRVIPQGIGDLVYLETLDLRGTLVDRLPKGILKLKELRHLLVSRSNRSPATDTDPKLGVKAPSKLGDLTSLQKLCMIELKPVKVIELLQKQFKRERFLEKLGKLTNLRRLGISMLLRTDMELLCSSIEKLTNLEALRLIAAPGETMDLSMEDKGQALEYLQRLHLTGCLRTLPSWILHPDSLVKLVLKRSQLIGDPLQHLGTFWCLKHLELEQAFDVTDMKFEAGKFHKLHFLGLDGFDRLASIKVEKGALPTLERLSLARCKSLTVVPQIITYPTKLKCLKLCGMPKEFDTAVKEFITMVKGNEEIRAPMEVNFKEWKDPAQEVVIPLPARGTGIPSVLRPFKK